MDTRQGPSLRLAGRAAGWLAVGLLAAALALSIIAFLDVANDEPRSLVDVLALAMGWLALTAFPLALLAALVGVRLRSQETPPLLGPALMVAAGAGVLWWVHGAWLLIPAGVLLVGSATFEAQRRLARREPQGPTARGVATDL